MTKLIVLGALALATWLVPVAAYAQATSREADCGDDRVKRVARAYLTGEEEPQATWIEMLTAGAKKLAIDADALEVVLPKATKDKRQSALVTIPFTATNVIARLTYTPVKDHKKAELVVCHYALKKTAKSWAGFELAELTPLFGRVLGGVTGPANVRLGGAPVPEGHRASTVAVVLVWHDGPTTPTVKLRLESQAK